MARPPNTPNDMARPNHARPSHKPSHPHYRRAGDTSHAYQYG
ncbi:hypothetical protein DO71_3744 [Burkholderia pseudomallei]|nr:hypothetical protein DO71_3744 [Burkholderia pseudomallei]